MSIYAYVGMPGSGKSYDVVANQIMPALKQGRRVVTNIPLHLEAIRQLVPDADVMELPLERIEAQPEVMEEYALPGVLLVIDECWRLWPSGLKAHQVPEVYKTLLAEHRHRVDAQGNAMQIVLVTQDLQQLAAFARQLVEQTFYHTKLTHVGSASSYRIDVYRGPQTGSNPPRSERLREILGRYDRGVFKLYKSHTMSESGQAGANEQTMDGRGNIWRRPMIYVAGAGVVLAFAWGIPAAVAAFEEPGPALSSASGATGRKPGPGPAFAAPAVAVPSAAVPGRAASPRWRVAGTIISERPSASRAILTDGATTVAVPLDRFCDRTVEGWTVCQWQGMEVTEWSAAPIRAPLPPAVAAREAVVPDGL